MMGATRGRLAVALDLLTDALAMVGQHGVYCQSARTPGRPTMDIALVLEQIGDAKELLQSVIELDPAAAMSRDALVRRLASSPTTTCSSGWSLRPWRAVSRPRHAAWPHGRGAAAAGRLRSRGLAGTRSTQARALTRCLIRTSHVFDVGEHDGRVYLVFEFLQGPVAAPRNGRAADERPTGASRWRSRSRTPSPMRTLPGSCTAA